MAELFPAATTTFTLSKIKLFIAVSSELETPPPKLKLATDVELSFVIIIQLIAAIMSELDPLPRQLRTLTGILKLSLPHHTYYQQ